MDPSRTPITCVLVYMEDAKERVCCIRKDSPSWMKGKLNLPGGKIEPGEAPIAAAARELEEETGYVTHWGTLRLAGQVTWTSKGDMEVFKDSGMYVFRAPIVGKSPMIVEGERRPCETEEVEWHDRIRLMERTDIMPNLPLLVPLISGRAGYIQLHENWRDPVGLFDLEDEVDYHIKIGA